MKAKLIDLTFGRDGLQHLHLCTADDLRGLMDEMGDSDAEVSIKKWRPKRSLDANAYFWVLADKLAAKLGVSKEEVYRESIRSIPGVSEIVCVQEKAADKLRTGWTRNGLGWMTDVLSSRIEGCVNVVLYYGSSTYDTAQMSHLIDAVVQDCRAQGIETMSREELEAMIGRWA